MPAKTSKKISVIHGPNLNLLGSREASIYGNVTLSDINNALAKRARAHATSLTFFQSNHEGALVDHIQSSAGSDGILINPAAYTHTSIAIRDALLAIAKPFVEVHLSNPKERESFRHHSYLSDIALAVVSGKGENSYYEGLDVLIKRLHSKP